MQDYEKHLIEYTKGIVTDLYSQRYITGKLYSDNAVNYDLIQAYDNWLINVLPRTLGEFPCNLNDGLGTTIRVRPNSIVYDKPSIETIDPLMGEKVNKVSRHLYPKEARDNDLTYAVRVRGSYDVFDMNKNRIQTIDNRIICEVPCLVGSTYCHLYGLGDEELLTLGECNRDAFAYFIVKGVEYTLNLQCNLSYNCPIIYTEQERNKGKITTTLRTTALTPLGTFVNNIKLSHSRSLAVDTIIAGTRVPLNPFQVMRILTPTLTNDDAVNIILTITKPDNRAKVMPSLTNTMNAYVSIQDDFMDIVKKRNNVFSKNNRSSINREISSMSAVLDDLDKYLYPHINQDFYANINRSIEEVRYSKIMYLFYNVSLYLQYMIGDVKIDDRNNWATKQTCNLAVMFERLFLRIMKNQYAPYDGTNDSNKKMTIKDFSSSYSHVEVLDKFISSIEKNIWIVASNQRASPEDKNVVLTKDTNILAHISALKRINIPSSAKGRQMKVRSINLTQLRFVCIWETPEGERAGLVTAQGSSAVVSCQASDDLLYKILVYDPDGFNLRMTYDPERPEYIQPCILNGKFIGFCNAEYLRWNLVRWKTCGIIDRETGIYIKNNALFITTMGARALCPTLIVGDGNPTSHGHRTVKGDLVLYTLIDDGIVTKDTSYDTLTKLGCIEYMDAAEQDQSHVLLAQTLDMFNTDRARYKKLENKKRNHNEEKEYQYMSKRRYNYCEITPNSIIGIAASIVPLPQHNQPARNTYQAAMGKQAQGIYHSNACNRLDREAKMLVSPARPILSTEISTRIGLDDMPSGETVQMAIVMDPYTQEDAIVMKKGSIDRGLFNSIMVKTHRIVIKSGGEIFDRLTKTPDPKFNKHTPNAYRNLHHDGLPIPGTYMEDGDCLLGIIHYDKVDGNTVPRDISIYLSADEAGIVEKIYLYKNSSTSITINIKVRSIRVPIPGDKFAARHAQKGTIGAEIEDVNMPFNPRTGVSPDLIYNTHGMPSRMTLGMIKEIIVSKVGAISARNFDASAFNGLDTNMFSRYLHANGYSFKGTAVLYDGQHGGMYGKSVTEIDDNGDVQIRRVPAQVYEGPCYYQRLKHESIDKIHERGLEGKIDPITRLPVGGSDDGAIRFGEMERDVLISHGASVTSRERLITLADDYVYTGCTTCGTEGRFKSKEGFVCLACTKKGRKYSYGKCRIPYSLFRIRRLLAVIGINMKLDLTKVDPNRRITKKFTIDRDAKKVEIV